MRPARVFSTGGKKQLDLATATQTKRLTLEEAISILDQQIEQKRDDLARRQAEEQHTATINRLVQIAAQGAAARRRRQAKRAELNDLLREQVAALVADRQEEVHCRAEWIGVARTLAPGLVSLLSFASNARAGELQAELDTLIFELKGHGADLSSVLNEGNGGLTAADHYEPLLEIEPFGRLIYDAEQMLTMAIRNHPERYPPHNLLMSEEHTAAA